MRKIRMNIYTEYIYTHIYIHIFMYIVKHAQYLTYSNSRCVLTLLGASLKKQIHSNRTSTIFSKQSSSIRQLCPSFPIFIPKENSAYFTVAMLIGQIVFGLDGRRFQCEALVIQTAGVGWEMKPAELNTAASPFNPYPFFSQGSK